MDLIDYKNGQVSHPGGPVSHERVGLLRGGDYYLVLTQTLVSLVKVAGADADRDAQIPELAKRIVLLRGQGAQRNDIKGTLCLKCSFEHGELSQKSLAGSSSQCQKHAFTLQQPPLYRLGLRWIKLFISSLFVKLDGLMGQPAL